MCQARPPVARPQGEDRRRPPPSARRPLKPPPPPIAIRYLHATTDVAVLDRAGALAGDDKVATDAGDVDRSGSLLIDADRPGDVLCLELT
jgi:hypothetical protein